MFDETAQGMHAGIRWTELPALEYVWKIKDPALGISAKVSRSEYVAFKNKDKAENFHVFLCTAQNSDDLHEIHYIQVGRYQDSMMTLDCHFVKCG